jgi:hypothetical protein
MTDARDELVQELTDSAEQLTRPGYLSITSRLRIADELQRARDMLVTDQANLHDMHDACRAAQERAYTLESRLTSHDAPTTSAPTQEEIADILRLIWSGAPHRIEATELIERLAATLREAQGKAQWLESAKQQLFGADERAARLVSERDAALARVRECEQDAKRYRWLREHGAGMESSDGNDYWWGTTALDNEVDRAIIAGRYEPDAALAEKEQR